ncbi:MAG: isocitrate/isopropylmalate family dehydrogenase [Candidatus Sericytochromatia bacterium]|nr:isocitrate/isopropylmalate family dehydrogenase [Candidatus Sericytochromatia bacterium]
MRRRRVALVPGDGIGPEVLPVAAVLMDAVACRHGFLLELFTMPWGERHAAACGDLAPPDAIDALRSFEAVVLGAARPAPAAAGASLDAFLRRGLGHRVRVRPMRAWPGLASPLLPELASALDGLLVSPAEPAEAATSLDEDGTLRWTSGWSTAAAAALAVQAFTVAARRPRRLLHAAVERPGDDAWGAVWREALAGAAAGAPEVTWRLATGPELLGALLMHPHAVDVVVAPAPQVPALDGVLDALQGGASIPAAAYLDPTGQAPPMLAPTHGPRPELVGHAMANPLGACWAGALALDALGERQAAQAMLRAIARVTAARRVLTPDLGGSASTAEVQTALEQALVTEGGSA